MSRREEVKCDRCGYVMAYSGEEQTYHIQGCLSSEASGLRAPTGFDLCAPCAGALRQFLENALPPSPGATP